MSELKIIDMSPPGINELSIGNLNNLRLIKDINKIMIHLLGSSNQNIDSNYNNPHNLHIVINKLDEIYQLLPFDYAPKTTKHLEVAKTTLHIGIVSNDQIKTLLKYKFEHLDKIVDIKNIHISGNPLLRESTSGFTSHYDYKFANVVETYNNYYICKANNDIDWSIFHKELIKLTPINKMFSLLNKGRNNEKR